MYKDSEGKLPFPCVRPRLRLHWIDAQADLSIRSMHMLFDFCPGATIIERCQKVLMVSECLMVSSVYFFVFTHQEIVFLHQIDYITFLLALVHKTFKVMAHGSALRHFP